MDINMDMFQWLINLLIISNTELAEELHKLVIRKVHLCVTDNIWVADLADMILMSKFNKGFRFLLGVSKYAWVIPMHYNY